MVVGVPFGVAALPRLFAAGRRALLLPLGAATVFALLAGYVFVSILELGVPADPNMRLAVAQGTVFTALQHGWTGFLRPVSSTGADLTADLQLSPGLWIAAPSDSPALAKGERRLAVAFAVVLLVALALLAPVASVAGWVWPRLPGSVLAITDEEADAVSSIPSSPRWCLSSRWRDGLRWGPAWPPSRPGGPGGRSPLERMEAGKLVQHGRAITSPPVLADVRLLPENTLLSRYSYEYYGHLPRYLLRQPDGALAAEPPARSRHARARPGLSRGPGGRGGLAPGPGTELTPTVFGGVFEPPLPISPGQLYLVQLDFRGTVPAGALQIFGQRVFREYLLPLSGEARAYGAGPGRTAAFRLRIGGDQVDVPETKFIATPGPGQPAPHLALRLVPLRGADLPVEVLGLIPYRLRVRSPRAAWVESPKIFLPGYRAEVDGAEAGIVASPDGLVMVRVPAGNSEVVVRYPGPPGLRPAYWLSACAWAALAAWGAGGLVPGRRRRPVARPCVRSGLRVRARSPSRPWPEPWSPRCRPPPRVTTPGRISPFPAPFRTGGWGGPSPSSPLGADPARNSSTSTMSTARTCASASRPRRATAR